MSNERARRAMLCAALSSLAVASCQTAPMRTANKAPLRAVPPVVVITMREYRFDYDRNIPGGRVVFRFVNKGKRPHRPSLLPLPEDLPPIDQQLHGSKRRALKPFAGIPDQKPGATDTFAVDLIAGRRYALICYAQDPDGRPHALKGMNSEFRPLLRQPPKNG